MHASQAPTRLILSVLLAGVVVLFGFGAVAQHYFAHFHPPLRLPPPIVIAPAAPAPPAEVAAVVAPAQPAPAKPRSNRRPRALATNPTSSTSSVGVSLARCENDPDPLCGIKE